MQAGFHDESSFQMRGVVISEGYIVGIRAEILVGSILSTFRVALSTDICIERALVKLILEQNYPISGSRGGIGPCRVSNCWKD